MSASGLESYEYLILRIFSSKINSKMRRVICPQEHLALLLARLLSQRKYMFLLILPLHHQRGVVGTVERNSLLVCNSVPGTCNSCLYII
jgi:hypothetical protein